MKPAVRRSSRSGAVKPTDGLTAFVGLQLRAGEDKTGVLVDAPLKNSPAENAGLKTGDAVLKVGKAAATDLEATIRAVRLARPRDKLEFQIKREGKEVAVTVTVGVLPFPLVVGLE